MVAQPAAQMAAVSSSGEEPEPEMSPEPAEQEQAAPSMTAMMALILQEVGGIRSRTGYRPHHGPRGGHGGRVAFRQRMRGWAAALSPRNGHLA
jgi:hypothetical protein